MSVARLIRIQYRVALTTGWTIEPAFRNNSQVRRDFHIDKLNDEFGQYSGPKLTLVRDP